ncbi:MAG: DUF624 domain-containing protein [Epulopiscium sp.]|nr:DUF624 domain-containing protein [Candidatus Epulonipiscium sp.]
MFSGLFSMDGPIYKFGGLVFDLFILNLLWVIFSLPFFTIGASTTALFYAVGKRVREEDGYLFRDFWTSFKMNFKQGTIVWLILAVLYWILYTNIMNIRILGNLAPFMYPLQLVMLIELTIVMIYIFPLLSRFHMKIKDLFKTAFFMANRHFITTILCIAAFAGMVFLTIQVHGIFILFFVSGYAWWVSFMLQKVFKKYVLEGEEGAKLSVDEESETPVWKKYKREPDSDSIESSTVDMDAYQTWDMIQAQRAEAQEDEESNSTN